MSVLGGCTELYGQLRELYSFLYLPLWNFINIYFFFKYSNGKASHPLFRLIW